MNTRGTLLFVILFAVMGLVAVQGLPGQVIPQGPFLTIFFTGDQNGEVASCGCPKEDLGGVTRRAAFLDTLRASEWDFLAVDAGDLSPFQPLNSQGRLKIETMARSMATMGYHAIALGDHDLKPGLEFVTQLVTWLEQPILATNYELPEGMSDRTRMTIVRNKKVGLLAFLDPEFSLDLEWLTIESFEDQKARVEKARANSDLLVVLLHASDEITVDAFISMYPEVDLVLVAHEGNHVGPIDLLGSTYVSGAAGRGRYLGRVEVAFGDDGKVEKMDSNYLPVVETWGRRPWIDALLSDYYSQMRTLVKTDAFKKEALQSLLEPEVEFVGNDACASCHDSQTDQYETTLHAHAHETLVREEKDHDPECQKCHTVGFGYQTGFSTPDETPSMWNVGCESCHGGGQEHVDSPEEPYGETGEAVCLTCHTTDNSPDFDYRTYRPKIVHSAGKTETPH